MPRVDKSNFEQQVNAMKSRKDVFGYYDGVSQETPSHDPGPDGICPVCCNAVGRHSDENPLKTISLMVEDPKHRDRSYFFRSHRKCWDGATPEDQMLIESSVIDEHVSCNQREANP